MSELKVNKITPKTGTSIQLGESGDTITIPCGATLTNNGTATGFGLSFCTTVKTSPFTATANKGFFVNTGSAVTVTLPASPTTGDEVIIVDQTGQAATNNITLGRNGSKIKALCQNASLNVNRGGLRLVYSGSSQGWITATAGNDATGSQSLYVTATGGTILTSGDFKTHVFTGDANFVVSCGGNACGSNTVDYLVVAGGGGGSLTGPCGAGAGAGGFRYSNALSLPAPETSPLANPTGLTVTAQSYPITVGGGGARRLAPAGCGVGCSGSNSVFSTITSTGGGGGGQYPAIAGAPGGSGGGGGTNNAAGGNGNTPPVSPPQGNNGGGATGPIGPGSNPVHRAAGGGGGAGAVGGDGTPGGGGDGGAGSYISNTFFGPTAPSYGETGPVTPTRYFAGGGGGGTVGSSPNKFGCGGVGGGGNGGQGGPAPAVNSENGGTNTGGGAGGVAASPSSYGAGGSGFVAIRYKYQN